MTATVITHPALRKLLLAERIADAKREVDAAERKHKDLQDGFLLWQQEYPESGGLQQWAVEQAFEELEAARAVLAALQAQAQAAPRGTGR